MRVIDHAPLPFEDSRLVRLPTWFASDIVVVKRQGGVYAWWKSSPIGVGGDLLPKVCEFAFPGEPLGV